VFKYPLLIQSAQLFQVFVSGLARVSKVVGGPNVFFFSGQGHITSNHALHVIFKERCLLFLNRWNLTSKVQVSEAIGPGVVQLHAKQSEDSQKKLKSWPVKWLGNVLTINKYLRHYFSISWLFNELFIKELYFYIWTIYQWPSYLVNYLSINHIDFMDDLSIVCQLFSYLMNYLAITSPIHQVHDLLHVLYIIHQHALCCCTVIKV
jgi:hypothetical protein